MALTNEDLRAISVLLDEKLDKKLDEKLKPINNRLKALEIKHDILADKMDDLNFKVTSLEHHNKKAHKKMDDEIETLIAVLEAKNILPQQA